MLTFHIVNGSDGSSVVEAFKDFFKVDNVGDVFTKNSGSVKLNTDFQVERLRRLILLINELYTNGRTFNIDLHNPARSGATEMYPLRGNFNKLYEDGCDFDRRLEKLTNEFFQPLLTGGKRNAKVKGESYIENTFVTNRVASVFDNGLHTEMDIRDIAKNVTHEIKSAIDACHEVIWYKHAVDSLLDVVQKFKMCLSAKAYETQSEMTVEETDLAYRRVGATTRFENLPTGCEIVRHVMKVPDLLSDSELGILLSLYTFSSRGGQWRSRELLMLESFGSKLNDIFSLYGNNVLADPFKHIRNAVMHFLPRNLSRHKDGIFYAIRTVELMYGYTQSSPEAQESRSEIAAFNKANHESAGVWKNKATAVPESRTVSYMGYHSLTEIVHPDQFLKDREFRLNDLTSLYPCEGNHCTLHQFLRLVVGSKDKALPTFIQCAENDDGSLTPLAGHNIIEFIRGICDSTMDDNVSPFGQGTGSRYIDVFGTELYGCHPLHSKAPRTGKIGLGITTVVDWVMRQGALKMGCADIIKRVHLSQMLELSPVMEHAVSVIATKVPKTGKVNMTHFGTGVDEMMMWEDARNTRMYNKYLNFIRGEYDGGQLMLDIFAHSSMESLEYGHPNYSLYVKLAPKFSAWMDKTLKKFSRMYAEPCVLKANVIKFLLTIKETIKRFSVQANLSDDNAEIMYKKLFIQPQERFCVESPIRLLSASSCIPPPSNNIVGVDILTLYDYRLIALVTAILLQYLEYNPEKCNEEEVVRATIDALEYSGVVQAVVDNMSPMYTFGTWLKGDKGNKLKLKQNPIVTIESFDTIAFLSRKFDI